MPSFVGNLQGWIALLLGVAAFAMEVFAFVDAVRHRPDAYPAAGKRTKGLWLGILGVGLALGFLSLRNPIGLLGIIAAVAAAIYLADVRPALRQISGRGPTRRQGPYGPW